MGAIIPAAPTYDALRQALGLTDAQAEQLQQIQKEHAASDQAVFLQMAAKQKQLSEALNSGSADASEFEPLHVTVPFAFTARKASLPTGDPAVLETSSHTIMIRGSHGSAIVLGSAGDEAESDRTCRLRRPSALSSSEH